MGLIGEDKVRKTKMINGWEKVKKEREREREQKEDENECAEFSNKPASLQQRRVRAANWHEAVVAVSHVEQ